MQVGARAVVVDEPVTGRRRADAAREVVALVDRDDEQRVLLVDPVRLQVAEERGERVVVFLQLLVVRDLAGAGGRARVRVAGEENCQGAGGSPLLAR